MQIFNLKRFHINAKLAEELLSKPTKLASLANYHIDFEKDEITIIEISGFEECYKEACTIWDAIAYTYVRASEIFAKDYDNY